MTKCIVEGCGRKAQGRGLCCSCYNTANRNVKAGETTWQELEQYGLALPGGKGQARRGRNPLISALEKARLKASPATGILRIQPLAVQPTDFRDPELAAPPVPHDLPTLGPDGGLLGPEPQQPNAPPDSCRGCEQWTPGCRLCM